jgi:hypothetical protein
MAGLRVSSFFFKLIVDFIERFVVILLLWWWVPSESDEANNATGGLLFESKVPLFDL